MAVSLVDSAPRPAAQTAGVSAFVEIDGIEYESRDFVYTDDVLCLADSWSVTLPCPDGKATALDGRRIPVGDIRVGALVRFRESDPDVEAGAKLLKLTGRLVDIADSNTDRGGFVLSLTGYDLGWHLTTGHGPVFKNYRGVKWQALLDLLVFDPALRWGFKGTRLGNLENIRTKIGPRNDLESRKFEGSKDAPDPGGIQPRFQVEVGQSIGPIITDTAKWERKLVNVSADGWLQVYTPRTSASKPLYEFHHQGTAQDHEYPRNNVFNSTLKRSASGLNTITQCWTTVVHKPDDSDTTNPNEGKYSGQYVDADLLSFVRRDTFSDSNQMGRRRAEARARWKHDRGVFDSWEYTFTTVGHSQNGIPFVSDTIASLRDTVRGIDDVFYVQRVKLVRKLAGPGLSVGSGTYSEITLRLPNLLGA